MAVTKEGGLASPVGALVDGAHLLRAGFEGAGRVEGRNHAIVLQAERGADGDGGRRGAELDPCQEVVLEVEQLHPVAEPLHQAAGNLPCEPVVVEVQAVHAGQLRRKGSPQPVVAQVYHRDDHVSLGRHSPGEGVALQLES
ncbi:hypothetical protein GW17_00041087, partial [Ensete ventricosum]